MAQAEDMTANRNPPWPGARVKHPPAPIPFDQVGEAWDTHANDDTAQASACARKGVKRQAGPKQRRGERRGTCLVPAAAHDHMGQPAEALHIGREQAHLRRVEQVDFSDVRCRAVKSEIAQKTAEDALVAVGSRHQRSFGNERVYDRPADLLADPGDQDL